MPITLNHSNIGVQYSSDKSYIIETVKSDLYLKNDNYDNIVRNNLQTAPVTPNIYIENGTNNVYAVESYTYSGSANTADYTRVFTKSTTCDILMIGGGGSGGVSDAGGGGAGACIVAIGQTFTAGIYTIRVGKGGDGGFLSSSGVFTKTPTNGSNSSIFNQQGNEIFRSVGGGRAGGVESTADYSIAAAFVGKVGGCGGGAGFWQGNNSTSGGSASTLNIVNGVSNIGPSVTSTYGVYGNSGGLSQQWTNGNYSTANAGGGGGIGTVGSPGTASTNRAGVGGNGLNAVTINSVTYNFSNHFANGGVFGVNGYIGGGGGGGGYSDSPAKISGGLGGGGTGDCSNNNTLFSDAPTNGAPNTGSGGGGGCGNNGTNGGDGGSGIVIIRYLLGTIPTTNLLTTEPSITPTTFTESIRSFIHSGGAEAQTTYTITVGRDTICDILIVGGGGGGAKTDAGGGGAGGLIYIQNITLFGNYTIQVGKKGLGGKSASTVAIVGGKGENSSIIGANANYIAYGGGGGGYGHPSDVEPGNLGPYGSSGGLGTSDQTRESFNINTPGQGHLGGLGTATEGGGGGGGSGGPGVNSGNGGIGTQINITGTNLYYAGGGGGGHIPSGSSGGLGGGGSATYTIGNNATFYGGGGGGGGSGFGNGGDGFDGIVIIKFKSLVGPILEGTTHKRLNFAYTPNYPSIQADNTNLKAWYKFDDPGNLGKDELNQRNLINTSVTTTSDLIGTSASFTNETYLSIANFNLNFDNTITTTGISFSFWFKLDSGSEYYGHLFTWGTHNTLEKFALMRNNLELKLMIQQGTSVDTVFDILAYNTWIHLVINIDTSRVLKVYQNTTLILTLTLTPSAYSGLTTSSAFTLGRANGVNIHDYRGGIEDFRIYNKVLTSTEISQLYSISTPNIYTVNFQVPTIADINNNSNIVLRGEYDIALNSANAVIIPKAGQYIPKPTTFINYSVERMYPPVRNFTAATTAVSGQTYGNGTYVVSYSSTFGETYDPFKCFNTGDIIGGAWAINRYTSGVFNSTSFIVAGYLGDWIKIQLPVAIRLTRFSILQRSAVAEGAPKDFKIYGSNDNITWIELVNKTDALYNASIYEQTTPEITNTYTYYGLVVNKLFGTNTQLNFDEWYIYGQEVLPSSLSLRYNLLNPTLDPIGAQWTYSSNNTNVYHMGSVGIGTTNPEYQLDVRGAIYSSVGGYTQTGLTTWSITSDRRIKENITRASYDICLENVKNIELYNFNFKNNCVNTNDKHQLGFIAQEVQQVYPKAVEVGKIILNTNEAISDILTLNTTQIDYTLYGAVKNLIEKIEDIDNDLESIEKLI